MKAVLLAALSTAATVQAQVQCESEQVLGCFVDDGTAPNRALRYVQSNCVWTGKVQIGRHGGSGWREGVFGQTLHSIQVVNNKVYGPFSP